MFVKKWRDACLDKCFSAFLFDLSMFEACKL